MSSLESELKGEVAQYKAATFAQNTIKTYNTHRKSYLQFCTLMGIPPVPVSENIVCLYAAYLARRLKSTSIRQYLNIVRLIHLESGYSNPCQDNFGLKCTLRGIDRVLGKQINRKLPIDPHMLLKVRNVLNMEEPTDIIFWAACLIMFFGLFRKSNLFPDKASEFNCKHQFVRSDFSYNTGGWLEIYVKWSKTIQYKERNVIVRLPLLKSHPLCPVSAIMKAFEVTFPVCEKMGPAFPDMSKTKSGKVIALTGPKFNRILKEKLEEASLPVKDVSSHSFRRGGVTWALTCQIPGEVVKYMGDWKSSVYLSYLDQLPSHIIDHYRSQFVKNLPV